MGSGVTELLCFVSVLRLSFSYVRGPYTCYRMIQRSLRRSPTG